MSADDQPPFVVDTREQDPLALPCHSVRGTLPVGDYGIEGFSDWDNPAFVVERKTLDDLAGSLTLGRGRLMREILKLKQFGFAAIVIEGCPTEIERHEYRSKASPESILASLDAIMVRHGIHIIWARDHDGAARMVERLARQFLRGIEKQARLLRAN